MTSYITLQPLCQLFLIFLPYRQIQIQIQIQMFILLNAVTISGVYITIVAEPN